jgi:MerR family transcriptional regulator, mercuric resistance operon regulatory protein
MRKTMTIGGFAKAAGVGLGTIRYYQRRGLLNTPARPPGSRRVYTEAMLARILFIQRAQSFGFTLDEVERALSLSEKDCARGRRLVEDKLNELDRRVEEINRMRRRLRTFVRMCEAREPGAPCPFLAELIGGTTSGP